MDDVIREAGLPGRAARADDQTRPVQAGALRVIDAHMHLWDFGRHYHAWLQDSSPPTTICGDVAPIAAKSYLPGDYRADTVGFDVAACVYVETGLPPQVQLDEADWVDGLANGDQLPTVIVAGIGLEHPGVEEFLARLSERPRVRGVRQILSWHEDAGKTYTAGNLLPDQQWQAGFRLLARHGFSFDLQVYPGQLAEAAKLADRNPDVPLILNHAGMPIDRDAEALRTWRSGLKALAERPNIFAKVSGLGMLDHRWTEQSIRPFVLDVVEAFGPERCMFGSNFPVDRLYSSFDVLITAYLNILSGLSAVERDQLFSGTASKAYRIAPGASAAGPDGKSSHRPNLINPPAWS